MDLFAGTDSVTEAPAVEPLWFKDAVIYQLHVKSFFDGNGDGIGDLAGLISRLDYVASLGVNTLWLLPFYPSPLRDDGYDISQYCEVHPDYGDMGDARRLIDEAHRRGLRVITELVINHTSDQHLWFQRARRAPPGSPERDFYVWSDSDQRLAGTRVIFLDTEASNWTWDEVAGAYFWHRFYSHQPDLNFDHPPVLEAVLDVMRFWLGLGVDGLRLDAVPYLVEREGTSNENLPETHAVLKRIRATVDAEFPGRMLLAEANQWPEDTQVYFGEGDECHMAFHFPLMPRMYMAIAQEDRFPITDIMRQTPPIPDNCQWAIFLRNHDELTLEMVTHKERDYLWETYAPDRRARLNLGIRRRLAPLVEGDRRRIELLNFLLLSMPGTPVIYYGDEIGMGDDLQLGDRDGVRTPMQWSAAPNGGFSEADESRLVLPAIRDPVFGYLAVNVDRQHRAPHSLLNRMRRLLEVRGMHRAFGRGTLRFLYPDNRRILVYLREHGDADGAVERILCVANVSSSAQAVELDLAPHAGQIPVELLSGVAFPPIGQLPYLLTLQPYGFFWFLLAGEARMPSWYVPPPEPLPDLRTLVLRGELETLLQSPTRDVLEQDLLPAYLARRPWYTPPAGDAQPPAVLAYTVLPSPARAMALVEMSGGHPTAATHALLPLGFLPEEDVISALPQQLAVSRLRRGARLGYLTDATTLDALPRTVLRLLQTSADLPSSDGHVLFQPTAQLEQMALDCGEQAEVRRLGVPFQDALAVSERAVLFVLRYVVQGTHPDVALGRYLTEVGFAAQLPVLGQVIRVDGQGITHTLMVAHAYLFHEGDAAERLLAALEIALQGPAPESDSDAEAATDTDAFDEALDLVLRVGALTGDLQAELSRAPEETEFAATVYDDAVAEGVVATVRGKVEAALQSLEQWLPGQDGRLAQDAQLALTERRRLLQLPARFAASLSGSPRQRIHGHLHPRLMLVSQGGLSLICTDSHEPPPTALHDYYNSPLADLAHVQLAFDRLAETFASGNTISHGQAARARRGALARRFHDAASHTLRLAWQGAATGPCRALLDRSDLLNLFLLDGAMTQLIKEPRPSQALITRILDLADIAPDTQQGAS